MKIYTKTGDKGKTKLVDGTCVEKFDPRVEAYGCVDELNSQIGLARSLISQHIRKVDLISLDQPLEIIQNQLFSVGSLLATEDIAVFQKLPQISMQHIEQLEKWIDQYNDPLPELKNFILPGGDFLASQLHVCRTACRRSERRSTEIFSKGDHYQDVLIYLNRLSDLFFVLARWVNFKTDFSEIIWKKEHV
jgi:cob(I)alamin adenosyltransferase